MKIDTCIIIKNEEKTIRKLIEQFLVFSNEIHITDTGSTDNTLNIVNEFVDQYTNIFLHHFEWVFDFSKARNYSLTCYDCKADYQFWCDGDDELNDKLINTLKEFTYLNNKDADIYFIKYQYYNGDQNPYYRTSLLKASSKLKWKDPVHEYISYSIGHKIDHKTFNNGSLIIHKINNAINHNERNLDIFKRMEDDNCFFTCRNRYYYARELIKHNEKDKAILQLYKCLDSDEDNNLDKYNACINLFVFNDSKSIYYFFKLFKHEIYRKDIFYYVGRYYFNENKYELAKFYYLLCLNCNEPDPIVYFGYNNKCHINSLIQLNLIEYKLGNIKNAIRYNEQVLQIEPNNKIALKNRLFYEKYINKK